MIQRIQTLYLLIATVLMAAMAFAPLAEITQVVDGGTIEYTATASGAKSMAESNGVFALENSAFMALFVVALLTSIISFVTIFSYKKRNLQLRLSRVNIVLLIVVILLAGLVFYTINNEAFTYTFKLPLVMPLLSMIFTWLAIRGIKKDIKLVNSLNRIR